MKQTLRFPLSALAAVLVLAGCNPPPAGNAASGAAASSAVSASEPKGMETPMKKVSYFFGYQVAGELLELKKNGIEIDTKLLSEAIADRLADKPSKLSDEQAKDALETVQKEIQANVEKKGNENLAAGEKFLAENKAKAGVKTTASGLQYKVNKEGTGDSPVIGDGVVVEYTGKLTDGTEFDSTKANGGQPFGVPLDGQSVIPGWTEGLQLMKEGGEYTLYVPAKLAYGSQSPSPKIPPNSVLVFDMKVLKIEKGAVKKAAAAEKADKKKK